MEQRAYHPNLLADILARPTVKHAYENTDFYHQLYQNIDLERIKSSIDLFGIPVVAKNDIFNADNRVYDRHTQIDTLHNTSGTTGDVLSYPVDCRERFFQKNFDAAIDGRVARSSGLRPIGMALQVPAHGTLIRSDSFVFQIDCCQISDSLAKNTIHLLTKEYKIPALESRVSFLYANLIEINKLIANLDKAGIAPKSLNLRGVSVTGDYMSSDQLAMMEALWGCPVKSRWGQAESAAGAWRNKDFDFILSPHSVPQLESNTAFGSDKNGRACREGELIITSLIPFKVGMPMIRYASGDIVATDGSSHCFRVFRYLGRRKNCATFRDAGGVEHFLSPLSVLDGVYSLRRAAIASYPDLIVSTTTRPRFRATIDSKESLGAASRCLIEIERDASFDLVERAFSETEIIEKLRSTVVGHNLGSRLLFDDLGAKLEIRIVNSLHTDGGVESPFEKGSAKWFMRDGADA